MRRRLSSIFLAIIIIGIGGVFFLKALGFHIDLSFRGWWTLFIILPCLASIIERGIHVYNTIGLALGTLLFLKAQNFLTTGQFTNFFVAALFLLIGLSVLLGGRNRRLIANGNEVRNGNWVNDPNERIKLSAVFNSMHICNESQNIQKGEVNTVFGSIVLDLTKAQFQNDTRFDVDAVFGNATILLPSNVNIIVNGTPFLGSIENKTANSSGDKNIVFYCSSIFAAITLK